jgi:hypothetical protein
MHFVHFKNLKQKATKIIEDLQEIINRFKTTRAYPFKWNLKLYRFKLANEKMGFE